MDEIKNLDEFKSFVAAVEGAAGYEKPQAFGLGVATVNGAGQILEVYFPLPNYESNYGSAAVFSTIAGRTKGSGTYVLDSTKLSQALNLFAPFKGEAGHKNIDLLVQLCGETKKGLPANRAIVASFIDRGTEPAEVGESYLRLHLLSHRLVKPHGISVKGIFKVLPNVAWTDEGCIDIQEVPERQLARRLKGEILLVHSVDKFPRMSDYVIPSGVRICDAVRVRLGAYVGEGTTFMHEGFCNFNAGTEGPNMVEGRISAGVFVRKDSDLGGGCSTMGTLSGGGEEVISVGVGCLLGANSGIGISLGDNCTVEAGLYVTAGSKVRLLDKNEMVKARALSGRSDLLFRRNSESGAIEALSTKKVVALNEELHANQ